MSLRSLLSVLFLGAVLLGAASPLPAAPVAEHDDCDSGFLIFQGAEAYQFSPRHGGELGSVRLFGLLSNQGAAVRGEAGVAYWQLAIDGPGEKGGRVLTVEGLARMDGATALAEHWWDGRDERGEEVAEGLYRYTFRARFLADAAGRSYRSYGELEREGAAVEAYASTDELILTHKLEEATARALRQSLAETTCEVQQNLPLEAGFGFNYYYGSTHSHSNWSDGGQPTTACSSGNAYGSGTWDPSSVWSYAKTSSGLDYWLINEHNHLIQDAIATNDPPVTEAKVRQRYAAGLAAAVAASVDDDFIALYGMEWGVSTNADQGHLTLIETPVLFGWETCSTCNGPNPECTAGTNCYFDVFTPKRFGYLTLYQRSVEHPSPAGPLGIFCHPSSANFDGFALNANADAAMQGIAVRSGLAFSTGTNCSDTNVGSTDYSGQWKAAIAKGFHLGPVADHDSHCNNFGQGIPNRTVYLLPNGASPVLTRQALMQAHAARHFFATEDSNAQLVFTATGGKVMGDLFTATGPVTLRAAVYDPAGESVSTIEVWRGVPGGSQPTSAYRTASGVSSLSFTESLTTGSFYYYVRAVQADGHDLWSAPMWISYDAPCGDSTPPTVSITQPAEGATISCVDTTIQVSAADAGGIASVAVQIDGGAFNPATFNSATGFWELSWASSTASSGSHTLVARATDASCGANVATTPTRTVTVANGSCSLNAGGWKLVQANSTQTYFLPAGTQVVPNGYVIVARSATKAQFETFWRGGTPLPSNVTYVNSGGTLPQINGSETYTLYDAANVKKDGATYAMSSSAGQSLQRKDPCNTPGAAASWNILASSAATPGTGAAAGCAKGLVINEFSDALGTGNFVYEFVELHWDQ
ncbi:MAG TPA: Ig-like domain-containing protein [Thermoanaerobaculia bacterium]|nr:Ig-like domain-containing protein [Thermoanaerobaculia bacterium]